MTLIVAAVSSSGDLVIAADRRATILDNDIGYFVNDDNTTKLVAYSNGVVVGIAGEASYVADTVLRCSYLEKDSEKKPQDTPATERTSSEYLADELHGHFTKWFDRKQTAQYKWPSVEIAFFQWLPMLEGGPRIVRLASKDGFQPRLSIGKKYALFGTFSFAVGLCDRLYTPDYTTEETKHLCSLLITEAARTNPTIGATMDMWVLSSSGAPEIIVPGELERIKLANEKLFSEQLHDLIRHAAKARSRVP